MKKFIPLLCSFYFFINVFPQNNSLKNAISVIYNADYATNTINPTKKSSDRMVLNIGGQSSEFYSTLADRERVVKDSLLAKGHSVEQMMKEREKIPRGSQLYRIYKNYPEKGKLTYLDKMVMPWYRYEETLEKPIWTLQSEKKEIIGYKCQKATTKFRGRTWVAFYTNEIPVSDGPWKLWGLPGLILEAYDSDSIYKFNAIGIKKNESDKPIQLIKEQYINCTRKDLHKLKIEQANDPLAFIGKSMGIDVKIKEMDSSGKEIPTKSEKYIGIETDLDKE